MSEKRGPGRPPKTTGEAKRAFFQTRIRQSLKDMIADAAAVEGRSLSEEIELRLEQSFRDDRIGARLADIERRLPPLVSLSGDKWRVVNKITRELIDESMKATEGRIRQCIAADTDDAERDEWRRAMGIPVLQ